MMEEMNKGGIKTRSLSFLGLNVCDPEAPTVIKKNSEQTLEQKASNV